MGTIAWEKPTGIEMETNDLPATVKYCEGLGWERIGEATDSADNTEHKASGKKSKRG